MTLDQILEKYSNTPADADFQRIGVAIIKYTKPSSSNNLSAALVTILRECKEKHLAEVYGDIKRFTVGLLEELTAALRKEITDDSQR